jgi:glycosyltransferase involved in cell wall biosynthesis
VSDQKELKNILYIVPSDFNELKFKGVVDIILDRDENGYFDTVYTIHPFARQNAIIELNPNNIIYEYKHSKFSWFNFPARVFHNLILLIKLLVIFPIRMRRRGIEVIRAQDPFFAGLLGVWYRFAIGAPMIVSIHSNYELYGTQHYMFGSKLITNLAQRLSYRFASAVLPIRESLKHKSIIQKHVDKISIFKHHLPHHLPTKPTADIRHLFGIQQDAVVLCFFGRTVLENRIQDLVEAMGILINSQRNVHLLVCGDGKDKIQLEHMAKEQDLADYITFPGFLERALTLQIRHQCDIAVNLVGGFSLLESALCRLPLVAYDIDWHDELIEHGSTGYLIKYKDVEQLVGCLEKLCDNSQLRSAMGEAAYHKVVAEYGYEQVMSERQKLYNQVLRKAA